MTNVHHIKSSRRLHPPCASDLYAIELWDQLIAGYLELREQHLPKLSQLERKTLFYVGQFVFYGGDRWQGLDAIRHNLNVVERLLVKHRPRPRTRRFRLAIQRARKWLSETIAS